MNAMNLVPTETELDRARQIKAKAIELGFDRAGITTAGRSPNADFLRGWLDEGRAGAMTFLTQRFDERVDPATYLPGARSVICVALNYFTEPLDVGLPANPGRIARYARGHDYHTFLKDRLYDLADWLREQWPGSVTRCGTDAAPIMEKELAARAGLGWVGKNTLVINPQLGSWLLLGEVITTLSLAVDQPITDHCGTCTRCLDACPTQALTPYVIDPRRCISYLTIESRGDVALELSEPIGDWLFGCDICQDVCPWNKRAPISSDPHVQPKLPPALDAQAIIDWTPEQYAATLRHTAVKRVKLPILKENAQRVLRNRR